LDIKGIARDEMLQPLHCLRAADKAAGAAPHRILLARRLVYLLRCMAAADRAVIGKDVRLAVFRALFRDDGDDLRDDIAGALDDHGIADADIFANDFIFIMQRRVGDDDAADGDGAKSRNRRQRAGAADLYLDILDHRTRLFGGEFMRDGPARTASHEAETLLPVEPIDLEHDAVDIIIEAGAKLLDIAVGIDRLLHIHTDARDRIDREAPVAEGGKHFGLRPAGKRRRLPPGVGEETELSRRGDRGVKLAQAPGG